MKDSMTILLISFSCFVFSQSSTTHNLITDSILTIEQVDVSPIYSGCVGNNNELKKCFNKKISQFIYKNIHPKFIVSLGKKKKLDAVIHFVVTKEGSVNNINVECDNKRLRKKYTKLFERLPKMIPAKLNSKSVAITHKLPIKIAFQ